MLRIATPMYGIRRVRGIFTGWWVALSAMGLQGLFGGLLFNSFGAYIVPLQAEFGWSRTMFAGAFSLQQVESGMLGPIQGWMIDRFGPRNVVRVGLVLCAAGFAAFSQVDSLLAFYASFLLIAIGASLGGYLTLSITLVNWFVRRRATATAMMSTGMSISGLLVPLLALSLVNYGWRATALYSAGLIVVLGLPLSQLLKHRPEDVGLLPDGDSEPARTAESPDKPAAEGFTAREAIRTPSFWFLSLAHAAGALMFTSVNVHLVSAVTQILDVSLETASGAVALVTGSSLALQIPGGMIGDRFNKRKIAAGCMLVQMIGMLCLAFATSWWLIIGFAMLHGAAVGLRGPLMTALRADYFGLKSIGKIMGLSSLVVTIGTVSGPLIVGILADQTGSYQPGFVVLACIAAAGSLLFLFATKPPAVAAS